MGCLLSRLTGLAESCWPEVWDADEGLTGLFVEGLFPIVGRDVRYRSRWCFDCRDVAGHLRTGKGSLNSCFYALGRVVGSRTACPGRGKWVRRE
jgi:hypothetical protein